MSVVDPDLEPLTGKDLFNHEVGKAISIDIRRSKSDGCFIRLECQVSVVTARDVETNSKHPLPRELSRTQKDRSVGPFVLIEVGGSEFAAPGAMQKDLRDFWL